ncbi:hypothetical protein PSTG_03104 [Puccinia striiformis f. sp. tritici PST-78]|uniref:Uncharacterized protein n=1 Tax=Puccinia striiformis f. sp. tritici PST-78 TaxID=1165861 RepID=A0A0L0VWD3_9BASI|nr:hypothetical protein PSTG_03104 [Puccinia striiformis f. sp. tritici PST-78]
MNPPGFDIGSGVPAGLPSRGWNERALNSSLVDQTLSSLTATGLNTTPSLNTTAINPSNTTTTATTPTTTSTQRPHLFEDDDDDDDGLPGLMMDDPPDGDQPETKGPKRYTEAEMEPFATMDLESLRAAANHYAVRRRMTQDMRDEVDDLYYDFECSLVRLAIQNRIKPHLFSHYLGHTHRIKGGTSWNNFQRYDPEARKLFDAYDCDEAKNQVGALWDTKPDDEKKKYRDPTFLDTLRPMTTPSDDPQPMVDARLNGPVQASHVTYEKTEKMIADWVHKLKIDMASMAFYHQVEGFFVLASLHPKSPIFRQGGSPFGNRFLNMIASKSQNGRDAPAQFHTWVAAQAIQIENGCQPTEIKRRRVRSVGDITDRFLANTVASNIHEIRIQLKDMIRISSGNKLSCAWPGENCDHRLKEMKLSLEIDENQWSLIPTDIMIPLEKLKGGLDRTVLACLSLNKIHITYHPDWEAPPSKIKTPDKRKHSSQRTPKNNSSTRPAPNASNSTALDRASAAPNASNSTALDHTAAAPNASNSTALDRASAAPNTPDLNASDRTPAAPNTSNSGGPKKRKRPASKTSNLSGSARAAAAPNASNRIPFDRASAARKARDSHFAKQAAAARNTPNLNNSDGVAADRPDSNNNNTDVSGSHNVEGSTSLGRKPVPVLDPLLDALGCGVAFS